MPQVTPETMPNPWEVQRKAVEELEATKIALDMANHAVAKEEATNKLIANRWESRMRTHLAGKEALAKRESDPFANLTETDNAAIEAYDLQVKHDKQEGVGPITEDDERYYFATQKPESVSKTMAPLTIPEAVDAPIKSSEEPQVISAKNPDVTPVSKVTPKEAAEAKRDEELREHLQAGLDYFLDLTEVKKHDVAEFVRDMVFATLDKLAVSEKWAPERVAERRKLVNGYLKSMERRINGTQVYDQEKDQSHPEEIVVAPTPEEIDKYSTTESVWELGDEINDAVDDYLKAFTSKDRKAAKLAMTQIKELMDKKAADSNWPPELKAARAAGLGAYLEDVQGGKPERAIEQVKKEVPEKKNFITRLRERRSKMSSDAGRVALAFMPPAGKHSRKGVTVKRTIGLVDLDPRDVNPLEPSPIPRVPRKRSAPTEDEKFWKYSKRKS